MYIFRTLEVPAVPDFYSQSVGCEPLLLYPKRGESLCPDADPTDTARDLSLPELLTELLKS